MKSLFVVQHTDSEFLGRIEDHFEGRGIRFTYLRPHTGPRQLPASARFVDGLVLLGGGPWGTDGKHRLPTLDAEVSLVRECLALRKPVIGIGLGAQILSISAGGDASDGSLVFTVDEATRIEKYALNGFLPQSFPIVVHMRGWPAPPDYARVLAVDSKGRPALFQVGENSFGFVGHPGAKRAMVEDLLMEFDNTPDVGLAELDRLAAAQPQLEETLVRMMTGLVQLTGWMRRDADD